MKQKLLAGKPKQAAIFITLDTWTSPNHLAFLGIVGSFINSRWERKEVLLGFEPLSGAHTAAREREKKYTTKQTNPYTDPT